MIKIEQHRISLYVRYFLFVGVIASFLISGITTGIFRDWAFGSYKTPEGQRLDIKAIAAGKFHSLVLKSDGSIISWGDNKNGQSAPPDGNDYVTIATGSWRSFALKSNGTIISWGKENNEVPSGADYITITAGGMHGLALKNDGSIAAWGNNDDGQATPPAGNDYIAIAAGGKHSLALKKDGTIAGWGNNDDGQTTPPIGNDYTAIAAGRIHSLALKADGSIVGWGNNEDGQAAPPGGNDYVAIAAGGMHSLALKADGSIVGWGDNYFGQTTIPAGNDYRAIAAGGIHSLALKTNGTIVGWGNNRLGQATGNYTWLEVIIEKMKVEQFGSLAFCTLVLLYFCTFKLGAVLVGFLSGRYLNLNLRYIFVLLVAGAGYHYCASPEHFFYFNFVVGNFLYITSCLTGLYFRHKAIGKIAYYEYIDTALIVLTTIICIIFYVPPEM